MSDDLAGLRGQVCPRHEDLLLAIDRGLGADGVEHAAPALASLARLLPPGSGDDPVHELACVAGVVRDRLAADPAGPLSLTEGLWAGGGHPLMVAGAAVSAAHRRGLRIALVGHARRVWLAHAGAESTMVVSPADATSVFDARSLGVDLRWHCAHELGGLVLAAVRERAERHGDLTTAMRAAELRTALPLNDVAARADRHHLERLRARLN